MSFEEKLIEGVKENEVIYNLKHKNYRRIDIKEKIWENIANDLHTTADHCKKRWKSLRDKYIKLSRLPIKPSGSAADESNFTKWKYFSYLTFLQGFNKAEKTSGNFSDEDIFEPLNEDESEQVPVSASGSSTMEEVPRKKRCARKDIVENQFKEVLSTATEALQAEISSANSSTRKLFEALAQRIDEENLPSRKLNELHMAISNLVYESINDMKY